LPALNVNNKTNLRAFNIAANSLLMQTTFTKKAGLYNPAFITNDQ
jgi:hypothetical protein